MSDLSTAWLHLSAGRGPAECALAVARLAERVETEAAAAGVAARRLEQTPGREAGTLVSALMALEGEAAAVRRVGGAAEGVSLWICPSPFRPHHKRKTWFLHGRLLAPPAAEGGPELRREDLKVETFRASGPGGQNVNKRDTAVRIRHRPSGTCAQAQEERSQARNKALALARLAAALADDRADAARAAKTDLWRAHDQLTRGDAARTFRGPRFALDGA